MPDQVAAIADELGPVYGPLVVFAAETALRTNASAARADESAQSSGSRSGRRRRSGVAR
jgi:hypothetical protein